MGDAVIHPGDVQAGDLVFLTRGTDDLDALVTRLDGSRFSHVGIADGANGLYSCRTALDGIDVGDLGGVRHDGFERAWTGTDQREVWAASVELGDDARRGALDFVSAHLDLAGESSRSGFAVVKLFVIAMGLNATRHAQPFEESVRARMWEATLATAREWHWSKRQPNFFCSEFVAAAYGMEFAEKAFDPPEEAPESPRVDLLRPPDQAAWAWRILEETPSGPQAATLLELLRVVSEEDSAFLRETVRTAWRFIEESKRARDAGTGGEHHDVLPSVLPTALVTPRMLLSAPAVGPLRKVVE